MPRWNKLTNEQLNLLPTHRLYEVYKRYVSWDSWISQEWAADEDEAKAVGKRRDFIKGLLDAREHLERTGKQPRVRSTDEKLERLRNYYRIPSVRGFFDFSKTTPLKQGSIKDDDAENHIGAKVAKSSGKPFKSRSKSNTVAGIAINPHTKRVAFTFEEDSSCVDVFQCKLCKVK